MARKTAPTISQEELYPPVDEAVRDEFDDARLLDLDAEVESPFLRAQKRVSVHRGSLPRKTATRLTWTAVLLVVMFLCTIGVAALYHYGERSWRFRIESSDSIEISGLQSVTRLQVMEVMGGDIGRNIFFVPLAQRKKQLEQIPWVESASVMRFVPNRLRIEIQERTPMAFARIGPKILLVDAVGTLMELPAKKKFSFPVILGMNVGEPLSTRAARMNIYRELVRELDAGGAHYSQDLSEVDLSDPDDVKVLANNREGEILVHLGSGDYLSRYKIYVSHVQEWRQQFQKLESVDLRYDRQIIVNPDRQGTARQPPLSSAAAKRAMAAGVKPAVLVTHAITLPETPAATPAVKPWAKRKKPVKAGRVRPAVKRTKITANATLPPSKPVVTNPGPNAVPKVSPAGASKKPSPAIAKGHEQR
jgi:cell division protein FtsQ